MADETIVAGSGVACGRVGQSQSQFPCGSTVGGGGDGGLNGGGDTGGITGGGIGIVGGTNTGGGGDTVTVVEPTGSGGKNA
jgi:hypothetical protein